MELTHYLDAMVAQKASDLFFTVGAPVNIKVEGLVTAFDDKPLGRSEVRRLVYGILSEDDILRFEQDWELDFGYSLEGRGRFRINLFRQRGEVAMVVRYLHGEIPDTEALGLPGILRDLALEDRGLVLVVGATGSGKSTTLASMIDHRNRNRTGHILTLEDPVEYLHEHRMSIVNQREIGTDTHSYASALRRAMREAPNVILIGEIRDTETMEHALAYANTGHLCLSTLHSTNAYQTMERIVGFFPETQTKRLLMDLSLNLRAIVSQRLVMGVGGRRMPAVEVLLNTPYVSELIQKGQTDEIREVMEQSSHLGMRTFDASLLELYRDGHISAEEALRNADSRTNLSLQIKLAEAGGKASAEGLSLTTKPFEPGQIHDDS